MIAEWMARAVLASVLIAIAAWLGNALARLLDLPRRWVWAGALASAIVVPALALWRPDALAPATIVDRLLPAGVLGGAALGGSPGVVGRYLHGLDGAPRDGTVMIAWSIASLAVAAVLLYTTLRLRRARRAWRPAIVDGGPVLLSPRTGPAVMGLVAPAVVVPAWVLDVPANTRTLVLRHEREHLRAGDSRLLAAAAVAVVLAPWNLAIWWMLRRLRMAVESDCDARVLAQGADVRAYGEMLLTAAAWRPLGSILSPALGGRTPFLERRILDMTTGPRRFRMPRAAALVAAAAIAGIAACDTATPTEAHQQQSRQAVFNLKGAPLQITDITLDTIRLAGGTGKLALAKVPMHGTYQVRFGTDSGGHQRVFSGPVTFTVVSK